MVILFDIDGTLIDHDTAEICALDTLRARMRHEEDSAEFMRRWRIAFERHYNRYLLGELSIEEQRRERFREVFDPAMADAVADQWIAFYLEDYLAACRLYSDVMPALEQLSGYPMGIISNGDRGQQQHKLVTAGIDHYFAPVIVSGECGFAKPDARIFELACQSMGVSPSDAVYVGDRRDIDAEGARRAGMHGIWLDRMGGAADGDRQRVDSLSGLSAVIQLIDQRGEA